MKHILLACAALIAAPVSAETVAITGGRVVIGDGSAPIDNGTVLVTDGRIVAASQRQSGHRRKAPRHSKFEQSHHQQQHGHP